MKRNSILLISLLLSISVSVISCKKKHVEEAIFTPKLDTNTSSTLVISGHYKNFEAIEAEIDRFNKFYPNVEIVYTSLDNYNETILTSLAGYEQPDIFMGFQWMIDKPKYAPLFAKCQNMADEKNTGYDLNTIRSSLIYHNKDGFVPMIPILAMTYGMLVNEDLFQKEELKIPETYSELIEVCSKFKEHGYNNPLMTYNISTTLGPCLIYTDFSKAVQKNPAAINALNNLEPEAGEYIRPYLEWTEDFRSKHLIDFDACKEIKDNYNAIIMRFFKGDVPMMLCSCDTASGTEKRESRSKEFTENPFKYSFHILPANDNQLEYLFYTAVELCVNKDGKNLAMTNEFMRFLLRTEELNNLAKVKRLVTCSNDYSYDSMYSSLQKAIPIYQYETGIFDNTYTQVRIACYEVVNGNMSVDEAVSKYGKL